MGEMDSGVINRKDDYDGWSTTRDNNAGGCGVERGRNGCDIAMEAMRLW